MPNSYLSALFGISCKFTLFSGVICFQPEELPSVFVVRQAGQQQILSAFVHWGVTFISS